MWRLNRLSNVARSPLQSAFKNKKANKTAVDFRSKLLHCKEDTRSLWCGLKNNQAASPLVKPARNDYVFHEGQEIEGFTVEEVGHVAEFHLTAYRLYHKESGAKYLHIDRHDSNNVFSVHLRTTPLDSTGLPHILEHTTLCGSERFPVRDPFFKMLARSMATFMNAMTGPDYTFYPFSTQNRQDFNNLMSVYLDAVFRPKLRELDFKQEGWRLEHEDVTNKSSPIIFKGVVYNEMKGVFADNSAIFGERLLNSILPSHTYGVISGGDPPVIPSLTHQDLVAFHRKFYEPSNARFYSYGNFSLQDHLKYLSSSYLSKSSQGTVDTSVPPEPRWTSERREHYAYRPDPMASDPLKQSSLAVGLLTADITNIQDVFELEVITELLVKGPNSAFYRTLVEPNIGSGLSPVTGFTSQTRDTFFAVGLQGMKSEDFDKVINIIDQTLLDVVNVGFDQKRVEEVLHGVELGLKHQSSDFGMKLLFGLTPLWNHDADLLLALRQGDQVAKLRKNLKNNPHHLQDKVKQYLVGNPHRLVLSMSPEQDYEEKLMKAESDLLEQKVQALSDGQKELIYSQGLELQKIQQAQEDLSVLPNMQISDIKDETERHDLKTINFGSIPLQFAAQPTNGITYFQGILNTAHLSNKHKDLFSLFCSVAARMGTKDHTFRDFDHMVEMKTGGLGLGVQMVNHSSNINQFEEGLRFNSFCLDRNFEAMLDLWLKLFKTVTLEDENRFKTLVKNTTANLVNNISSHGHSYAITCARSQISPIGERVEISGGLTHISAMKKLAAMDDLSPILSEMQNIAKQVFNKNNIRLAINVMPDCEKEVITKVASFLDSMPGISNTTPKIWSTVPVPNERVQSGIHHIFPIPVNFAAKSVQAVPYTDPDFCALEVLAKLLSSQFLHPNIREKGGAYGSGASVNKSGVFNFFSYRDPNSTATFKIFDDSYNWIAQNKFTDEHIAESKLRVFQSLDAPIAPGYRGHMTFADHITYDMLHQTRQKVKSVSRDKILDVATKYLKPENISKSAYALIGPDNKDVLNCSGSWKTVTHE